jgi:hypothetical protein
VLGGGPGGFAGSVEGAGEHGGQPMDLYHTAGAPRTEASLVCAAPLRDRGPHAAAADVSRR